jgi:hypothetical protein
MDMFGIPYHKSRFPAVFASHFGVSFHNMDDLWLVLKHKASQYGFKPYHLLWFFWYWVYIGLDLVISCLPNVYLYCFFFKL